MKKRTFLLLSLLFTLLPVSATTYDICEGETKTLTASQTGKAYKWLQNGVAIPGAINKTYEASESGEYTCEITQEGTGTNKFNLVEYGNFDFAPNQINSKREQTINDPLTGQKYKIRYELRNFNQNGKADPGESTTTPNPNKIKPQYFSSITPKEGSHLLACDGGSQEWQVWSVRDMKLKKGQEYQFSCWAANIDKEYFSKNHGEKSLPKIAFVIENEDGKKELGVGFMTLSDKLGKWEEYKATYKATKDYDWTHLYIINKTAGTQGNDFALDEVYFGAVPTSTQVVTEDYTLNVHAVPVIQLTEPQTVCEGEETQVKATITGSTATISWTENGVQMADVSTTLKVRAPANEVTNTYKIKVSNGVCPEVEASTTVTGKQCGNPPIDHPVQNVCLGASITLTAETQGDHYLWGNGESTRSITVTPDALGSTTYSCEVSFEKDDLSDQVENFPIEVEICTEDIEIDAAICEGEEYNFHETICTEAGDYEFTYTTAEGVKLTETLHLTVNKPATLELKDSICQGEAYDKYGFVLNSTQTQTVGIQDLVHNDLTSKGCDSTTTLHLEIYALPVFEIVVDDQSIEVQVSKGEYPFTYVMDEVQEFTDSIITDLTVGTHELKVTDAHQCASSLPFTIEQKPIQPALYFSPNGDGINDVWKVEGIQYYPMAILQIYDRNNKRLAHYHMEEFEGWDGIYNGHELPADDYWFLLTIPELEKQITGHFTLKR